MELDRFHSFLHGGIDYRGLRDRQNPIENETNDKALLQKASSSRVAHVIRNDKEI